MELIATLFVIFKKIINIILITIVFIILSIISIILFFIMKLKILLLHNKNKYSKDNGSNSTIINHKNVSTKNSTKTAQTISTTNIAQVIPVKRKLETKDGEFN